MDSAKFHLELVNKLILANEGKREQEAILEIMKQLNADMIADDLFSTALKQPQLDPFLLDGFARGLERLGPAGLKRVVDEVASNDKKHSSLALQFLQAWRGREGLDEIMRVATGAEEIPSEARVNLFHALRELGDVVPPEPIALWLDKREGGASARAEAVRVLAAMGKRSVLAVGPIMTKLIEDEDRGIRLAGLDLAGRVGTTEGKQSLIKLAENAKRPLDERGRAVAGLRSSGDKTLRPSSPRFSTRPTTTASASNY